MNRSVHRIALIVMVLLHVVRGAWAQIIINVPPDPAPALISGNTVLNLSEGGELPFRFTVGGGATLNMIGGTVSFDFRTLTGGTANISGGRVVFFATAESGSLWNISGLAIVDSLTAESGSSLEMAGGTITGSLQVKADATANIRGGTVAGTFSVSGGSVVTLHGVDFELDGVPISGLEQSGDAVVIQVPIVSQLTGTLEDGTPFAFSYFDNDAPYNAPLTLVRSSLPTGPATIVAPGDAVPRGVFRGQSLVVNVGGAVGNNFQAGSGSAVTIQGGSIGANFEAAGADVEIMGGQVGNDFGVFAGSVVEIRDGVVGTTKVFPHAAVNLTGGQVASMYVVAGGEANIRGGSIGWNFWSGDGAAVAIVGDDFRMDGVPIAGLDNPGDRTSIRLPGPTQGYQFTGTLADGTPFAFTRTDYDSFDGPITLERAVPPPTGPAVIRLPSDPVPRGLRSGQTLIVDDGGMVGDHFNAGAESRVEVRGGAIGADFEAVGAVIDVSGGTIGANFDVFGGSTLNLRGGTIGQKLRAKTGSTVNVEGGHLDGLIAEAGSIVNVVGGQFGSASFPGGISATGNAIVNIRGGQIGGISAYDHAMIHVFATAFLLNGMPIDGLQTPGQSLILPITIGDRLEARLLDGSNFDLQFGPNARVGPDFFAADATLRLTVGVPEPSALVLLSLGMGIVAARRRSRMRMPEARSGMPQLVR